VVHHDIPVVEVRCDHNPVEAGRVDRDIGNRHESDLFFQKNIYLKNKVNQLEEEKYSHKIITVIIGSMEKKN
jgi:hypothetical protein